MRRFLALAVAILLAAALRPAGAYEAATTHAGLTEQAALHSKLHERLRRQFGYDRGLLQQLIVPPADAPGLFRVLRRNNPAHGFVPDGRGRQSALSWLVAGSAVADSPSAFAANHYLDPLTGEGIGNNALVAARPALSDRIFQRLYSEGILRPHPSAADWVVDAKNPMGLTGFLQQYAKAVQAKTPGERERHLAGALLAAGAILHVLEDMGSPSHVRDDLGAHLVRVGPDRMDIGSRFEEIASLAYGRLGVPEPTAPVRRDNLRAFFTAKDGLGLADLTSSEYFSRNTLPRPIELDGRVGKEELGRLLAASVRRPAPVPLPKLDLIGAARGAVTLTGARGQCLARYRLTKAHLVFSTDDDCALEQLALLLPRTGAYATGLLDYLFRGDLAVYAKPSGVSAAVAGAAAGAGTLELFWDDVRGVRSSLGTVKVTGASKGKQLGTGPTAPAKAVRVVALFVGVNASGEPLVATGQLDLSK